MTEMNKEMGIVWKERVSRGKDERGTDNERE